MLSSSHISGRNAERGLTLMEVLFALLISGIFLVLALRLLTEQWRGASLLKNHLEAHYFAMTAGRTVSDVIRMAQAVEWTPETGVLYVLPLPDDSNLTPSQDSYFVSDLDHDGTRDLYWRHLGTSQPVASYITGWECVEVEQGLWEIFLRTRVEDQTVIWKSMVRQRVRAMVTITSSTISSLSVDQKGISVC